jgi:hypothetical protein
MAISPSYSPSASISSSLSQEAYRVPDEIVAKKQENSLTVDTAQDLNITTISKVSNIDIAEPNDVELTIID